MRVIRETLNVNRVCGSVRVRRIFFTAGDARGAGFRREVSDYVKVFSYHSAKPCVLRVPAVKKKIDYEMQTRRFIYYWPRLTVNDS